MTRAWHVLLSAIPPFGPFGSSVRLEENLRQKYTRMVENSNSIVDICWDNVA